MSALPDQPLGGASRHGRAADAFIASYVRELLTDDELDAPANAPRTEPLPAPVASPESTTVEASL